MGYDIARSILQVRYFSLSFYLHKIIIKVLLTNPFFEKI